MSFSDSPAAVHSEVARQLRTRPCVVAADELAADETASGSPELDVLVQVSDRGTLPNCVTWPVVQSSLGIAAVRDANAIGHKQVIVR